MAQVRQKIKGEYTYPSEYSETPDGALKSAKNISINRDSIAEPRRGFNDYRAISAFGTDRTKQLLVYKNVLLAHYGSAISRNAGDPFTVLTGTFDAPSHNDSYVPKLKYIEANSNFYFTSNTGIQKEDSDGGTIATAGAPRGLDLKLALTGSSGFMTTDTQVAYRIIWGKKDANNNLILGSPSQRVVIANSSGGSRDVILDLSVPQEVTTAWFFQVYRSGLSLDASTEPNDELGLVYEANPTSTEITNKYLTLTDATPDDLRGASLYTNESQEGAAQANDTPPSAKDIALFKNCSFLANTIQKQSLTITLLAAYGASGINWRQVTGDTTNASAVVINLSAITGIAAGQQVKGIGIPEGTTVLSVDSATQVTLSANATATNATTTLEFADRLTLASLNYDAFSLDRSTFTFTVTIASPAVFTSNSHGLSNGSIIKFSTTGALPTGLVAGTTYYVKSVAANTFQVSATYAGASVNTSGVQSGTHTAVANDQRFKVSTAGSPAQNNEDTAQAICRAVNRASANTLIYAYYYSNSTELPGKIFLESRTLGASSFAATLSSHGSAFNPVLPTSGTTISSDAEGKKNRLHVSKSQRYESFPRAQYFDIGASEKAILRILPLRESLIIMKEDGFFRLTGTTPFNFNVDPLDLTTILLAPESAVALNNQIFCVSNQGVTTVSDTGVGVISRPIEDQIQPLLAFSNLRTTTFAFAYETARQYILCVPTAASDTYAMKQHVYNTFTQAWTHWLKPMTCALVNPADDKIYFGSPTSNYVKQERKTLDHTDFCDEDVSVTVSSISGLTLTLVSTDGISVGDVFVQGSLPFTFVTDVTATTIDIEIDYGFAAGSATTKTSFECEVKFASQYCQNPGIMKHIREVLPLFKELQFSEAQLIFSSDLVLAEDEIDLTGFVSFLWGYFSWGEIPFGGYEDLYALRAWVPPEHQRCTFLNVTFKIQKGFAKFALAGLEYTFEALTERTAN